MDSTLPDFPATDALDRDIARMLAADARLSFRKIAADLGVTEGTVRGRVRRMQNAGLLKLIPVVDIARARPLEETAGSDGQHMMFLTIKCASGMLEQVRDGLLALPEVSALYDANAALRLVAVCILPSMEAGAEIMHRVLALPGIREAESEFVLQTIKHETAIGPIATREDALLLGRQSD
ncbi:MAG: Lrp/AsnC family transcriptional regulator [Sphingomonadales bacterium]|nr:Lrp/AsnC family transcriptional regulator [Sphingomonadales bacterium]